MKAELVSVIVPAYNAERYLAPALDSVFKQAYPSLEVIVVDDGSTDSTQNILKEYSASLRVITQKNQGPAVARNAGIRVAHGSYLAFIDADDVWTDNHLALMLPHLEGDAYDFVRGKIRYVRNLGTPEEEMLDPIYLEPLVGACLYRKEVFDRVGLFDESMRQGEDFDWSLRLEESGCKEKRIEETTLLYRRHEHNLTAAREVVKKGQFEAFRKRLLRAKAQTESV